MSTSSTEITQGDNSVAVVDNSKTKNVEKTVSVEKTVNVDTTRLEDGQTAMLDELVKIGRQLQRIINKGSGTN